MQKTSRYTINTALWLLLFAVLTTLPMLGGIIDGNDIGFHLSRIEGLKGAITQFQFPARIYPIALAAYGYAAPLYYPDVFLLPAAVLRILGLPMSFCYAVEIFL